MNNRYLFTVSATLIPFLLLALLPTTIVAAPVNQELLLLYSNDVNGETEACG